MFVAGVSTHHVGEVAQKLLGVEPSTSTIVAITCLAEPTLEFQHFPTRLPVANRLPRSTRPDLLVPVAFNYLAEVLLMQLQP